MSAPVARGVRSILEGLKHGWKSIIPLIILVLFTLIGAVLFQVLEGPFEKYTLESLEKERRELMENTVFRLNNIRGMKPQQAYNHTVKTLIRYQEKLGVEPVDPENQQRWTFWGAMFYCLTVYTTIGYGNIFPVTTSGRVFTIMYAFIGIPLTLICLYYLGLAFAKFCRYIWKLLIKTFGCFSKDLERRMSRAVGLEEGVKNQEDDSDDLLSFPISFLALLTVIWILICAAIFAYREDWDYGTSIYFTLISFTTIGFGDITPNENGVIVFGLVLFIGLALVSTVLNLIQQQIEALATGMQANIDKEYMTALAEAADEGEISHADLQKMTEGAPEEVVDGQAPPPGDNKALDAVIARMPLKERLLFKVMPAGARKQLENSAQQKANRRTRACQTDNTLLEALIKEEILKMELNNELERRKPRISMESPFASKKPTIELESPEDEKPRKLIELQFEEPKKIVMPPYEEPKKIVLTMAEEPKKEPEEEEEEEKQEEGPVPPVRPHRGFKIEKVTEVAHDEEKPVISTTVLQEDDV